MERLPEDRDEDAIQAASHPDPVPVVTEDMRLEGIHHITGLTHDIEEADDFYQATLGLELVKKTYNQDAGQTHHIAFRAESEEEQLAWREHLLSLGVQVTPVQDRSYFKSIYFRAPDGLLLEIATDGPGFAIDEPEEELGSRLRLPEWLEQRRPEIEASLTPL